MEQKKQILDRKNLDLDWPKGTQPWSGEHKYAMIFAG